MEKSITITLEEDSIKSIKERIESMEVILESLGYWTRRIGEEYDNLLKRDLKLKEVTTYELKED